MNQDALLRRYRVGLGIFIVGLVLSGISAFPLLRELELLAKWAGAPAAGVPADAIGLHLWLVACAAVCAMCMRAIRGCHTDRPRSRPLSITLVTRGRNEKT